MRKSLNIFLFLFASSIIISCSKDDNGSYGAIIDEPDTTNYFFVRMNGQPWQPTFTSCWLHYLQTGQRNLLIAPEIDTVGIVLSTVDFYDTEYFPIPALYTDTSNYLRLFYYGITHRTDTAIFYTSNMVNGYMTITYRDDVADRISGNFEFTVIDTISGSNDTIRFTEGHFVNLHYNYTP